MRKKRANKIRSNKRKAKKAAAEYLSPDKVIKKRDEETAKVEFSRKRGHVYKRDEISIYKHPCDNNCGKRFKTKWQMKRHKNSEKKGCNMCVECYIYTTQIIFSVFRLS